jgi:hypothetical protein
VKFKIVQERSVASKNEFKTGQSCDHQRALITRNHIPSQKPDAVLGVDINKQACHVSFCTGTITRDEEILLGLFL